MMISFFLFFSIGAILIFLSIKLLSEKMPEKNETIVACKDNKNSQNLVFDSKSNQKSLKTKIFPSTDTSINFLLNTKIVDPKENEVVIEEVSDHLDILYASNVEENWQALEKLIQEGERKGSDLIILTNVFKNPLPEPEQCAFRHAFQHIQKSYSGDSNFSDIYEYIQSFASDLSEDITSVSAKKILKQIELGIEELSKKIEIFKEIIDKNQKNIRIIPGLFENRELINSIDPDIASYYLNLEITEFKGLNILGIGGQNQVDPNAPLIFQNRDYYEGTEDANEEIKSLLLQKIDLFATFTPLKFFSDSEDEKKNTREMIDQYLPGKVILTSQIVQKDIKSELLTATNAILIKGGYFGKNLEFWQIRQDLNGLVDKKIFKIKKESDALIDYANGPHC